MSGHAAQEPQWQLLPDIVHIWGVTHMPGGITG
jgi:hypothetical protein